MSNHAHSPVHRDLAQRAVDLLGDGKWHNYEKVVHQLMKLIPPGRAIRRNEKERAMQNPNPRKVPLSIERQIASGQRAIVRDFLKNSNFETDKAGSPRAGGNFERHIRMLRPPRMADDDPWVLRRAQLEADNEMLSDQVDVLRKYLAEIGHGEVAERLAPARIDGYDGQRR